MYVCMCMYIYVYVERGREGGREGERVSVCVREKSPSILAKGLVHK